MWVVFAFVSAVLLGMYDVSKKKVLRNNTIIPVLCLNTLISTLLFSPFVIGSWSGLIAEDSIVFTHSYAFDGHLLIFFKSLLVMSSWICGYYGIKNLPLSIVGPINATRPVMVLMGALTFLGEHLNLLQWIGVITAITSFYLLSRSGKKEGINFSHNKWIALIVLSNLFGALSALYDRWLLDPNGLAMDRMAIQSWFNFYQFLMLGAFLLICGRSQCKKFRWDWWIPLISIFLSAADFMYFYLLTDETAMISIVSMIRRSSVVVSFIFAALLFKEKNLRSKFVDLLLVIISLLFLFYGSC